MAKAIFLGLPLTGHTNPALPLVRELVSRGDEVIYFSTQAFAEKIEKAHAHYRPYRNVFLADLRQLPDQLEAMPWLLMRTIGEVLSAELDGIRAEKPDYLIVDSVAPWGQWVAEILGVPVVTSICTFALNRSVALYASRHGVAPKSARLVFSKMRYALKALRLQRTLRAQCGVRGPGLMGLVAGHSALNIVYTSRYLQPCSDTFDGRFHFIGPSIASGRSEDPAPFWDRVQHSRIVYISLGTLFNASPEFYLNCFDAFRDQDFQVILSVGSSLSSARLGPAPGNFIVQESVPQLEVLRRASAFATHGGMNSVNESFYYGVPVVVVPQMNEQKLVGRRVEELGAGLFLAKESATPARLLAAVRQVLANERYREQAARVGESLQTAGGVAHAADAILRFTRGRAAQTQY